MPGYGTHVCILVSLCRTSLSAFVILSSLHSVIGACVSFNGGVPIDHAFSQFILCPIPNPAFMSIAVNSDGHSETSPRLSVQNLRAVETRISIIHNDVGDVSIGNLHPGNSLAPLDTAEKSSPGPNKIFPLPAQYSATASSNGFAEDTRQMPRAPERSSPTPISFGSLHQASGSAMLASDIQEIGGHRDLMSSTSRLEPAPPIGMHAPPSVSVVIRGDNYLDFRAFQEKFKPILPSRVPFTKRRSRLGGGTMLSDSDVVLIREQLCDPDVDQYVLATNSSGVWLIG